MKKLMLGRPALVLCALILALITGLACGGVDEPPSPDETAPSSADDFGTTTQGLSTCMAGVPYAPHCHPDLTEGCCWTGHAPVCLAGCPAGFDPVCKSADGDGNFETCAVGTHKYCCT